MMRASLFSIVFGAYLCSLASAANCPGADKNIQLELVWMLNHDSTGRYFNFTEELRSTYMPQLLDKIENMYPACRVGVAVWGDMYDSNLCYVRPQGLTSSMSQVKQTLSKLSFTNGGDSPENAFMGMFHAMIDPAMGWTTGKFSSDGKRRVVRVILMSTDDRSVEPKDAKTKRGHRIHPAKDFASCTHYMSPSDFGDRLREHDISLIGLVSGEFFPTWQSYYEEMGKPPGSIQRLDLKNFVNVLDDMTGRIDDAICEAAETMTTTTTTAEPTTTTAIAIPVEATTPTIAIPEEATTDTTATATSSSITESSNPHTGLSIGTMIAIAAAAGAVALSCLAAGIFGYMRREASSRRVQFDEGLADDAEVSFEDADRDHPREVLSH